MNRAFKFGACALVVSLWVWISKLRSQAAPASHPATLADQQATEDRIRKPGWWPTQGSYPRSAYVGDEACAKCHAEIVSTQRSSSMA